MLILYVKGHIQLCELLTGIGIKYFTWCCKGYNSQLKWIWLQYVVLLLRRFCSGGYGVIRFRLLAPNSSASRIQQKDVPMLTLPKTARTSTERSRSPLFFWAPTLPCLYVPLAPKPCGLMWNFYLAQCKITGLFCMEYISTLTPLTIFKWILTYCSQNSGLIWTR